MLNQKSLKVVQLIVGLDAGKHIEDACPSEAIGVKAPHSRLSPDFTFIKPHLRVVTTKQRAN